VTAHILHALLPVFVVATAGWIYGRVRRPDMTVANRLNMELFMPALIFHVVVGQDFELARYAALALGGAAVILGSGLVLLPVARILGIDPRTFLPPMMFTNYGNLGLPIAVLAFGEPALGPAVVLLIVGNTLHFTLGIWIIDRRASFAQVVRIPFVAVTIAALAVSASGVELPELVLLPIGMLGQIAIPLMLFSLGVRLTDIDFSSWRIGLLGGILCPLSGLVIAVPLLWLLPLEPLQASLFLVFAALPPAVLNYLVAESYRQEPAKVASIVMIGNLVTIVVLPVTLYVALG
jgi:malate permease and related proteins